MTKRNLGWFFLLTGVFALVAFCPILALAYDFESQTRSLTGNLINTVLPLLSTLALVYAVILAFTGDAGAKARIVAVIACSIVGFLAPHFIEWLKAASGH